MNGSHPPSTGTPRRARLTGDERRASILSAARREFARAGYHGASTASIARAADCSEPMLYKHFAGKLALFTAALEEVTAFIEEGFDELLLAPGQIIGFAESFVPQALRDPRYVEMVRLRKLAIMIIDEPSVRATLEAMQARHIARTRALVERLREQGVIHPDVDPDYVAWTWSGFILAGCYREAMEPGGFTAMLPHITTFLHSLRA